jgi:dihydroorotase
VLSGNPKFFLGTDSAPHPRHKKESSVAAAGVFTGPYVLAYLANALDAFGGFEMLDGFARRFGRRFYGLDEEVDLLNGGARREVGILKETFDVPSAIGFVDDEGIEREIVPYKSGQTLKYRVILE